jgi:hypothetical protein
MADWNRSSKSKDFGGCRACVHLTRESDCIAFPDGIPMPIVSAEVDHMVKRPGQAGDTLFEAGLNEVTNG